MILPLLLAFGPSAESTPPGFSWVPAQNRNARTTVASAGNADKSTVASEPPTRSAKLVVPSCSISVLPTAMALPNTLALAAAASGVPSATATAGAALKASAIAVAIGRPREMDRFTSSPAAQKLRRDPLPQP